MFGYFDLRRTLEKRLRQLRTDYIDIFLFLGVLKEKEFSEVVYVNLAEILSPEIPSSALTVPFAWRLHPYLPLL